MWVGSRLSSRLITRFMYIKTYLKRKRSLKNRAVVSRVGHVVLCTCVDTYTIIVINQLVLCTWMVCAGTSTIDTAQLLFALC